MYDRWEFNTDGTFHFWHVHQGTPLDRGVYQYEVKEGILTVVKDGTEESAAYAYAFKGKTLTLTPTAREAAGHGTGHGSEEHGSASHQMGALPETETSFTLAK
jgi:hypothetical protein